MKVSSPSSEAPPKASPTEEKTEEAKKEETIPDFVEEEMDTSQLVCDGVIGKRLAAILSIYFQAFYIEGSTLNIEELLRLIVFVSEF